MYKRSEPSTRQPLNYQSYNADKPFKSNQTDLQDTDTTIDKYINDPEFIKVLNKRGITKLFPIQQHTFRPIYQSYDIIARDRTGSGKTLAFTLPILQRFREKRFEHREPKMLVVLPTRQLAIQVNNQIQSLRYLRDDFRSLVVYGKSSIQNNVYRLQQGVDILIGTPGRLNDLIQRGDIKLSSLQVICLDQADQILKQGFKQEIDKIFRKISQVNKNKIQYLMFSATVPDWLKKLSAEYQSKNVVYINLIKDQQITTSKTIKHLSVDITNISQNDHSKLIQKLLEKYGNNDKRILIFCDKKVQVDNLSKNLRIYNEPLHGDITQNRRQRAYNNFKNGSLKCIIATNVAARGLDFPSVDLIIQMTPPMNPADYIHRAGRTGRAGKQGTCITFFDRMKKRMIYKIQDEAKIKLQQINVEMDNIRYGGYYQPRSQGFSAYQNTNNINSYSYGASNLSKDQELTTQKPVLTTSRFNFPPPPPPPPSTAYNPSYSTSSYQRPTYNSRKQSNTNYQNGNSSSYNSSRPSTGQYSGNSYQRKYGDRQQKYGQRDQKDYHRDSNRTYERNYDRNDRHTESRGYDRYQRNGYDRGYDRSNNDRSNNRYDNDRYQSSSYNSQTNGQSYQRTYNKDNSSNYYDRNKDPRNSQNNQRYQSQRPVVIDIKTRDRSKSNSKSKSRSISPKRTSNNDYKSSFDNKQSQSNHYRHDSSPKKESKKQNVDY